MTSMLAVLAWYASDSGRWEGRGDRDRWGAVPLSAFASIWKQSLWKIRLCTQKPWSFYFKSFCVEGFLLWKTIQSIVENDLPKTQSKSWIRAWKAGKKYSCSSSLLIILQLKNYSKFTVLHVGDHVPIRGCKGAMQTWVLTFDTSESWVSEMTLLIITYCNRQSPTNSYIFRF